MTTRQQGKILLSLARKAIAQQLNVQSTDDEPPENSVWLQQPAACFVTLTQHGQLRGCIGSLEATRPLLQDVMANAKAAAFNDPRFSPLTAHELEITDIEVSLLSPLQEMVFTDQQDALSQIKPGSDGLVIEYGRHRGTFLPQVWDQLPAVDDFMRHLKQKAGLSADFWADDIKLYRYSVSKWKETDEN